MKPRTLPTYLLALGALLFGPGCGDQPAGQDEFASPGGDESNGETIFGVTCGQSTCHGENGVMGPGANLPDVVPNRTNDALEATIRNGVAPDMPPQQLMDQQIIDVLTFLRLRWPHRESSGGTGW